MARKPMVTRTIVATEAEVMKVDVTTERTFKEVVTVPRTYKTDADLLKAVKEVAETDNIKVVHIIQSKKTETLYGMTETEFIAHATIFPSRTAKTE